MKLKNKTGMNDKRRHPVQKRYMSSTQVALRMPAPSWSPKHKDFVYLLQDLKIKSRANFDKEENDFINGWICTCITNVDKIIGTHIEHHEKLITKECESIKDCIEISMEFTKNDVKKLRKDLKIEMFEHKFNFYLYESDLTNCKEFQKLLELHSRQKRHLVGKSFGDIIQKRITDYLTRLAGIMFEELKVVFDKYAAQCPLPVRRNFVKPEPLGLLQRELAIVSISKLLSSEGNYTNDSQSNESYLEDSVKQYCQFGKDSKLRQRTYKFSIFVDITSNVTQEIENFISHLPTKQPKKDSKKINVSEKKLNVSEKKLNVYEKKINVSEKKINNSRFSFLTQDKKLM